VRWVLITFVAACGSNEPHDLHFIDAAPNITPVASWDLIVSDRYTRLIPTYDFKPGCEPQGGAGEFPAVVGECTYSTDALNWPCGQPSSCLESVTIGGITASQSTFDIQFYLQGATLGTAMVMSGCDQTATVPIDDLADADLDRFVRSTRTSHRCELDVDGSLIPSRFDG